MTLYETTDLLRLGCGLGSEDELMREAVGRAGEAAHEAGLPMEVWHVQTDPDAHRWLVIPRGDVPAAAPGHEITLGFTIFAGEPNVRGGDLPEKGGCRRWTRVTLGTVTVTLLATTRQYRDLKALSRVLCAERTNDAPELTVEVLNDYYEWEGEGE